MLLSGDGISWLDILGSISSTIAIIIFVTGRESLAELLGLKKPAAQASIQKSKKKKGKLSRSLNKPGALLIGLVFSIIAFYSFFYQPSQQAIYQDNRVTNNIQTTNETKPDKKKNPGPASTSVSPSPPKPTVAPLTGIEVLNADNSMNADASQKLTDIIINKSNQPVIQGRLLAAIPVVMDSTATTKILAYKVSLTLKIYNQDGIHSCNTRFFETTIHADDLTSVDKIKQHAMAIFSREIAKNPAGITCQ